MIRVSRMSIMGHLECGFAAECANKAVGKCSAIEIISNDSSFGDDARSKGLKPEQQRTMLLNPSASAQEVSVVTLCDNAIGDRRVIDSVRALLPHLFVDDPAELATLTEVQDVAWGVIQNPDTIVSSEGLGMLERVTAEEFDPYGTGYKFFVDDAGRMDIIPTFDKLPVEAM